MGGSLGAVAINNAIRENLDELLKQFQIIHLCGRGHYDTSLDGKMVINSLNTQRKN